MNGNNITNITKVIQVGKGQFDKIGIHRITKNLCGCSPQTVVMIPGSNSDFNTSFSKVATFLASHGIDVWGIDFRYSFVPNNIDSNPYCIAADCTFFKDQDTNLNISDLDIVVKLAELTSKNGKVFLSGWSQGAYFAYRYAINNPNLKGIIPVEIVYNLDPTLTDIANKTRAEIAERMTKINSGIFYEDVLVIKFIASQAATNPDGLSTIIPGLTNKQAALFALTQTFQLGVNPIPNYRFNQGDLIGLKYTDLNFAIQQGLKLNSFQSILLLTELREQWLNPQIPNITVPILYIGAEFGFGNFGLYTPDNIKVFNTDVTEIIIKDYGHADLVYSNTLDVDVWKTVCQWMRQHTQ